MKVHRIYEKYGICLKLVDILDAEFILELRTNGSWIFKSSSPASLVISSWFIVAEIGFIGLKLRKCTFDIKKANKKVLKFQRRFKSSVIGENEDTYFFELDFETFVIERDAILHVLRKRTEELKIGIGSKVG